MYLQEKHNTYLIVYSFYYSRILSNINKFYYIHVQTNITYPFYYTIIIVIMNYVLYSMITTNYV